MSFSGPPNDPGLGGLSLIATTGPGGFPLQNGTPVILTWTPPNDGKLHRTMCFAEQIIGSAETGGLVSLQTASNAQQLFSGGQASGRQQAFAGQMLQPGETSSVTQATALTAGAATVYAELWGS